MKTVNKSLIFDYIRHNKTVKISQLLESFDISDSTLRRYLKELEESGEIKKHYGGVQIVPRNVHFKKRLDNFIQEKYKVGKIASSLVEDNDVIFLDSGTTIVYLADCLKDVKNVTVVTNNLNVLNLINESTNYKIKFLGGDFVREGQCCASYDTVKQLKKYNFDKAFLASNGVNIHIGATNSDNHEHEIKLNAVIQSKKKYLLADNSKFSRTGVTTFASLNDFDGIITNICPNLEFISYCNENNIKIFY